MSLCQLIFHIGRSLKLRVLFHRGGGIQEFSFFLCFEILGSLFHFAFAVFGYLFSRLTFSVLGVFDGIFFVILASMGSCNHSLGLSFFGEYFIMLLEF